VLSPLASENDAGLIILSERGGKKKDERGKKICYWLALTGGWGGTRQHHFDGTDFEPYELPENAQISKTVVARCIGLRGADF